MATRPQEVAETTPFDLDRRPAEYDPAAAQRWFTAMTTIAGVFDRWRANFFGRTGIQLWWGAFDLALLLFSGKHALAPTNRGYLRRYDLHAVLLRLHLPAPDRLRGSADRARRCNVVDAPRRVGAAVRRRAHRGRSGSNPLGVPRCDLRALFDRRRLGPASLVVPAPAARPARSLLTRWAL